MNKTAIGEAGGDLPRGTDVRPVIATASPGHMGLWVFLAVLLAGGTSLFWALASNREQARAPSVLNPVTEPGARISAPPPLGLPAGYAVRGRGDLPRAIVLPRTVNTEPPRIESSAPAPPPSASSSRTSPASPPPPSEPFPAWDTGPRVVFEAPRAQPSPAVNQASAGTAGSERVTASRFANPSRTVPKGTVIPAVLETALDSTRPGAVRALVQRDIRGFDGTRVLVPRGSRVYGEYTADLAAGQKRAMIRWTRLMRPDGVMIALDSPASDPLGRAGVKGKVDSKFLQRFGGAILQSVLDIGVGVATSKATDGVIVALPGSTQNVRVTDSDQIQRTLKVKHGTSVSVFVARDLDFSSAEF